MLISTSAENSVAEVVDYNVMVSETGYKLRNRVQAMTAFPWLRQNWATLRNDIIETIDDGKPLLRKLAYYYDVHPYTIRRACRLLRPSCPVGPISVFLWLLDGMKPDCQPKSQEEFKNLLSAHQWLCKWHLHNHSSFVRHLSKNLFQDGIEGARKLFRKWCPSHNLNNPYAGLEDYISERAFELSHERGSDEILGRVFRVMVRIFNLKSVFTASEHWHIERREQERTYHALFWPPILPVPMAVGNLIAHELFECSMLVEEGDAMHHCIGISRYPWLCAKGDGFVFSLRAANGKRKSTLYVEKHGETFSIGEHRAYANQDPDDEALDAADRLLEFLQDRVRFLAK